MNRHQRRAAAKQKSDDDGYNACCDAMNRARRMFMSAHPGFVPTFNGFPDFLRAQIPAGVREDKVALTAALGDCLDWWPADRLTRELLEVMLRASKNHGTYMQAKVVLESGGGSA